MDISNALEQFFPPQQQPNSFKEFLKGGAYGLASLPGDIAGLPAVPENLYSAVKQMITGEPDKQSAFSTTLNDIADKEHQWAADLLGVELDDFGTPVSNAGDAGYLLSQFVIPGGMLGKAAAKSSKGVQFGAELLDQLISRGKNKYTTAALLGATGLLAFDNPAATQEQPDLSQFFPPRKPELAQDQLDLSQFFPEKKTISLGQFFPPPKEKEGSVIHDAIKYGAPALAGLATAVLLHRAITKKGVRDRLNSISEKFGINEVETLTPKSVELKQGWLDRNASAKAVYRKANPTDADEFDALIDVSSATGAVETMFSDMARSGRIAGSTIKLPRMTDIYSKVGGMSPQQQKLLSEALDAGDRLSNIKYRGMADGDPLAHRLLLMEAKKDPLVGEVMGDMKRFYEGFAQHMYDEGLIDKDMLNLWKLDDFVYLPEYIAESPQGVGAKLVDFMAGMSREIKPSTATTSLFKRGNVLPANVKRMNPLDSMEQYSLAMLDYAHANKVRRNFVDTMSTYGKADKKYAKLVTAASDPSKAHLRVYRNGNPSYYDVSDDSIRNTLQFAPKRLPVILGTMNKLRQWKQATTTGKWRPTQAVRSAIYDVWTGANTSPSALGNFIRNRKDPTFGIIPGDVFTTTFSVLGRGLWENARARIADNASRLLVDSVNRSGVIAGMVGRERAGSVANKLANYYADSMLSMFRRVGASSLGNYHDISSARGLRTMMGQIDSHLSGHPNSSKLLHFYDGLLESVHNSVRLGFFSKNYSKFKNADPDLDRLWKLSRETRQLTGDPGIQGGGDIARALSAAVPYYNIGLQAVRRLTRAFQQRPFETAGAIAVSTVLPALATARFMSEDDETRNWFWNDLPPYERVSNIYVPSGSGGKPLAILLPNELRPFYAMSLAWFDTLFGFSNGAIMSDEARPTRDELDSWLGTRNWEDIKSSFMSASPLTETGMFDNPALTVILAMNDKRMSPDGSIIDLAPKAIAGPGEDVTKVPGDILSAEVDEVLRSTFGMVARDGINLLNTTLGSGKQSGDYIAGFEAGLDQYGIDVGQRLPIVGATLFPETKKLSLDTVDSRLLYDKLDGIKRIQQVMTEDIRQAGFLSTGNINAPTNYIGKGLADPRMQPVFIYANAFANNIMNNQVQLISNARDQYKAVSVDYKRSPENRAMLLNKIALHINALQYKANKMIYDMEALLEDQIWNNYGVHKQVRVEDLNKDTTLDSLPER